MMRALLLLAAAGLALPVLPAQARGLQHMREQDAAYQAAQRGRGMSFSQIRARIRVPGAQFIGAEFDGRVYRLKFMRGAEVIWIDVDAVTGQVLSRR